MILKIDHLIKNYQQAQTSIEVLKGLELSVNQGESIAILGQSGSGKSTLLSLLSGLDKPDSGSICISDENICNMNEKELSKFRAKNLGIVFQQFHLMSNLSAVENVALPLDIFKDRDSNKKALEALKLVGLEHRVNHFPNELSGGERQRVAIARAFVVNPKILLADEPSGNLDSETGERVMSILFDLSKSQSTTLILVTHNRELAKKCDRTFNLEDGRLTTP